MTDRPSTPAEDLARRIAERLAQMRRDSGMSQEAFGAVVGASQATVSRWEDPDAASTPSMLELAQLVEHFAVDSAWLLGTSDHRQALPASAALIDQTQLTAFGQARTPEELERLLELDLAFGTLWVQIPAGAEIAPIEEALRRVKEVDRHVRQLHPAIWKDWARLVLG